MRTFALPQQYWELMKKDSDGLPRNGEKNWSPVLGALKSVPCKKK